MDNGRTGKLASLLAIAAAIFLGAAAPEARGQAPVAADQPVRQVQTAPASQAPGRSQTKDIVRFRAPILVYHSVMPHRPGETQLQARYDVAPEIFDRQMQYLKENAYQVISLEILVDDLINDRPPPDKAVVLTFDDGWENQYQYALPALERYGLTATFFIYPGAVGKMNFMTWQQITDLAARGMAIGSHSRTHPILSKIKDERQLGDEIAGSKSLLEDHLGRSVDLFAYPFGVSTPAAVAEVQRSAFRAARGFQGGPWNGRADLYRLNSVMVTDNFAAFKRALGETLSGVLIL